MKRRLVLAGILVAAIMAAPVIGKSITPTVRAEEEDISAEDAVPFEEVAIDETNFPDENFRKIILEKIDQDKNKKLSDAEIADVTELFLFSKDIVSLKGIEYFAALAKLNCSYNQLAILDVSKNTNLKYLDCSSNQFTILDVSKNTALTELICDRNQLTSVDLSEHPSLEKLECSNSSQLVNLDVSGCMKLKVVNCNGNAQLTSVNMNGCQVSDNMFCSQNKQLTSLELNGCKLKDFYCDENNQLKSLKVDNNCQIRRLNCTKNPQFISLQVDKNSQIEYLCCYENKQLTSLDLSDCVGIEDLSCFSNKLTSLNVSGCTALKNLGCSHNQLASLDVSTNTMLNNLQCGYNKLTNLDVSMNFALEVLFCEGNHLTNLDVSKNPALEALTCEKNQLTSLEMGTLPNLSYLSCYDNKLEKLDISKCIKLLEECSKAHTKIEKNHYYFYYLEDVEIDPPETVEHNYFVVDVFVVLTPKLFDPIVTPTPTPTPIPTYTMPDVLGKNYEEAKTFLEEDLKKAGYKEVTVQVGWAHVDTAEPLTVIYQDPKAGEVLEVKEDSITVTIMVAEPTTPPTVTPTNTPTPVPGEPTPTTKPGDPTPTTKPGDPTPTTKPGDPTPIPDKDPSIADFVERLYTIALNRASEPEGKAFWVKEIEEGNRTGGDCAYFFLIESPEFKNRGLSDEDFVETLYLTFFDRKSEADGKAFWVGQLKNKTMTRDQVIMGFIDSKEWCNVCADYGVKSGAPTAKAERASKNAINFATRLYTCCLGREPEEAGLKYWSLALTNLEQTGCSAAKEFFTCQEFVNFKLKDDEYVKRLYRTFMDREPKVEEVTYWTGEIAKGNQTRASVLAFFGQSEEFTNICKKYGIDRGTI